MRRFQTLHQQNDHAQHHWKERQGPEPGAIPGPTASPATATVEQSVTVWTTAIWHAAGQQQQAAIWIQQAAIRRKCAVVWTTNAAGTTPRNTTATNGSNHGHATPIWLQKATATVGTEKLTDVMGRVRE